MVTKKPAAFSGLKCLFQSLLSVGTYSNIKVWRNEGSERIGLIGHLNGQLELAATSIEYVGVQESS